MSRDLGAAVFAALSDPTRREIVMSLSESGETSATELAQHLPVTRQAVVKHLAALADAGLVEAQRRGREKLYRLTPRPLEDAVSWMAEVGAQWDERLQALRAHLGPED
ncbi:MAG: ArsR/SmtB family transcription factor [Actinomycetota bacterium]